MLNRNTIAAAVTGAMLGISGTSAAGEEMTLRYGHANTTTYPYHTAGEAFAADLAEATGGDITVELFPQGQLGGERDILEGIQLGTVDFQALSLGVVGNEIQAVNVLNLPFIFASADHFIKVTTGEIGARILKMAQDEGDAIGVKVLAIAGPMFRLPMNDSRPIETVEDFDGLKFRTMEVPLHRDTYTALGATPVPLPFGEVYTALQTGVVDGNENGASALFVNRFHEVQKYVSVLPVVSNSGALVMSAITYDRLTEEQQQAVQDAAKTWTEVMNRDGLAQESEALEAMAEPGYRGDTGQRRVGLRRSHTPGIRRVYGRLHRRASRPGRGNPRLARGVTKSASPSTCGEGGRDSGGRGIGRRTGGVHGHHRPGGLHALPARGIVVLDLRGGHLSVRLFRVLRLQRGHRAGRTYGDRGTA